MQRISLIGCYLASSMVASLAASAWAADPTGHDPDTASGSMLHTSQAITCNDPGVETQVMLHQDLNALLGPEVNAERRRSAMRRQFTAAHYQVRDGLTDYE